MEVHTVWKLAPKTPSLMAATTSISYQFALRRKKPLTDAQVEEWFASLWSRPELLVMKKTKQGEKPVNIRPLWKAYELNFQDDGLILFHFEVAFGPQGTIRPDDFDSLLVAAFQIEQRRRTAVSFKSWREAPEGSLGSVWMAKEFLINVSPSETRMAVLEDGKLVELSKESHTAQRHIGNIYRGKVENVLPGMQAAFIDIGMEKNAFLFIDDLHPETGDNGSASISDLLREGQEIIVQLVKRTDG